VFTTLDWGIVVASLVLTFAIGMASARRAGASTTEFFLSGRSMPWWLLGVSMVATTFAADTPNLVTDLVRQHGVANNWCWWAFLLTGMLTVFVYAKLWRRSGALTDMEFYELRYDGKAAAFLRGFRALYLGVAFNVLTMANVVLAGVKIGNVMLGLDATETIVITSLVTVVFCAAGGFQAVVLTDLVQFAMAMTGAIAAAWFALARPEVGGLDGLLAHAAVQDKLALLPELSSGDLALSMFWLPIVLLWWSAWYPGAEPGGGGYVVQRMLAAKNERHSLAATLFFNVAHYALRPWPWILVALASLVVFPDLDSLRTSFPNLPESMIGHDLAYPAMVSSMPHGWRGLMLASLVAAYGSTISTHLNWGSMYVVNDFYKRFVRPAASERELVWVGRASIVALMALATWIALGLQGAAQGFNILISFGAGTGSIFLLRWFWPRINAWGEIVAMFGSGLVTLSLHFTALGADVPELWKTPIAVALTTVLWIATVLVTPRVSPQKLVDFYRLVRPVGPLWKRERAVTGLAPAGDSLAASLVAWVLGCVAVYSALFATGSFLYGRAAAAWSWTAAFVVSAALLAQRLRSMLGEQR